MKLNIITATLLFLVAPAFAVSAQDIKPENETLEEKVKRLEQNQSTLQRELYQQEYEENQKDAWSRRKSFFVGYSNPSLSSEGVKFSSNYGAFFALTNTYLLHKKPLLGMIRIGLDATWLDLNYYNHENGSGIKFNEDYDDYEDNDLYEANLGIHQVEIGLGIGPSVNVAPFCMKSNKLKYLRASVYFHVKPSLSMIVLSGDEDTSLYGAVPIFLNYGFRVNYRSIGIGIEGRTASSKYSCWATDYEELEGKKVKFKTNSFRAYISLNF